KDWSPLVSLIQLEPAIPTELLHRKAAVLMPYKTRVLRRRPPLHLQEIEYSDHRHPFGGIRPSRLLKQITERETMNDRASGKTSCRHQSGLASSCSQAAL